VAACDAFRISGGVPAVVVMADRGLAGSWSWSAVAWAWLAMAWAWLGCGQQWSADGFFFVNVASLVSLWWWGQRG
jgi:hypothetical protein